MNSVWPHTSRKKDDDGKDQTGPSSKDVVGGVRVTSRFFVHCDLWVVPALAGEQLNIGMVGTRNEFPDFLVPGTLTAKYYNGGTDDLLTAGPKV